MITFGINFFFVPLASPKVLSFDNKKEKRFFLFVLFSLIRTFAN